MSEDDVMPTPKDEKADAGTHMFLGLCILSLVVFTVWATNAELDIVSVATGEVSPSSYVQSVDHLEGGIVRAILVREGERVAAGQPLIELERAKWCRC